MQLFCLSKESFSGIPALFAPEYSGSSVAWFPKAVLLSYLLQLVFSEAPWLHPHYRTSPLLRASPTPGTGRSRLFIPAGGCIVLPRRSPAGSPRFLD
jgi:hypothetical protein